MQEVGPSVFFALLVITVSFLPIFTLEGTEGRLFKPLAFTKTYAMGFAALLSVTLTPALAALADPRPDPRRATSNPLNRWLVRALRAGRALRRAPARLVVAAALLLARARRVPAFLALGSEFMPPLNEGTILYMPTAPPGHVDRPRPPRVLQRMDRELQGVPRGRARLRQDRPRRDADRSGAALDGRDGRSRSQPRERVAPGHDLGRARRRRWTRSSATRACRTSGGCRSRRAPRCSRPASAARSASRSSATTSATIERAAIAIEHALARRARHAQRVRRALDRRLLPRLRRRPRRGRAPRRCACAT